MQNLFLKIKYFSALLVISLIRVYQKTFSFDHGFLKFVFPFGCCRFQPTCSEYAIKAIEKYGLIKGTLKACWRILRCNPWNKGGIDEA